MAGKRESLHIPGMAHGAPIPMGSKIGNIVYSSGVITLGSQLGAFGTSVLGPDITLNLGGLDLVDGAVYEWVLDTVTPVDGTWTDFASTATKFTSGATRSTECVHGGSFGVRIVHYHDSGHS